MEKIIKHRLSLQIQKALEGHIEMMSNNRRSATCYGKKSGTPLIQYDTEQGAQSGAAYVLERYGNSMVPYQCDVCNSWHLSPMDRSVAHSITCYGKVSGKILTQYDTNHGAQSAAAYVLEEHGKKMVPYQCQRCQFWHLSPIERQTEHTSWSCSCVGENNHSKDCYKSKSDAECRAQILKEDMGKILNVYRCPETDCIWHLTKKDPQQYAASKRSKTCTNREGGYRMEYDTEDYALRGANHAQKNHGGGHLSAYLCSSCGKWHIGSIETGTQSFTGRKSTTCTNKKGGYRMEYDTEEEAKGGVNYTRERYGRDVLAYLCSSCDKWHIG